MGERTRAVLAVSLLSVGEVASENLPTFVATLLGIVPPGNSVGQNINLQVTIWLRIYILLLNFQGVGHSQAGCHYGIPKKTVHLTH